MNSQELDDFIDQILMEEIKTTIISENISTEGKNVFHIKCEGEPVDTFNSIDDAKINLETYKKEHPHKEFIIEKASYDSDEHMFASLDEMGEQIEQNESKMNKSPIKVKNLAEAVLHAKQNGIKTLRINEDVYDVEECWKEMEEEELCEECDDVNEVEMSENDGFAASKWGPKGKNNEKETEGIFKDAVNKFPKTLEKLDDKKDIKKGVDLGKSFDKLKKDLKESDEQIELHYVEDDKGNVKNISKKREDADTFNTKSLKGKGKVSSKHVSKKDYDGEKVTVSNIKHIKESKLKSVRITEGQLVHVISNIVKEASESVPGLAVTKKAQAGSKKVNDTNATEVGKKLKDYLSFKGNDNPEFPKPIGKGEKVAINNTKEEDEVVDDNRGRGMENLVYDHEPSKRFKDRAKDSLEGDPKMGNAQETEKLTNKKLSNGAKVGETMKADSDFIKTDTGKKINKTIPHKEKLKKEEPRYKKETVPVKTVKESKINFASIVEEKLIDMSRELKLK